MEVEIALRGWHFGASECWRCPRAHLVVVSASLSFFKVNIYSMQEPVT